MYLLKLKDAALHTDVLLAQSALADAEASYGRSPPLWW